MKTILLYIHDTKLKLSIIRVLLLHNMHFIEASDVDEALIKMDMINDIDLIIEELSESKKQTSLISAIKNTAHINQIPILLLIPGYNKDFINFASKWKASDIVSLPLDNVAFTKKIIKLLGYYDQETEDTPYLPSVSIDNSNIKEAMDAAQKGKYSMCIVCLFVPGLQEEQSDKLSYKLSKALRISDKIIKIDVETYIILCPYTSKNNLIVIESKVKNCIGELRSEGIYFEKPHIYGVCYPDDIKDSDELLSRLLEGIEKSIGIRKTATDPYYQRVLSRYKDAIFRKNLK